MSFRTKLHVEESEGRLAPYSFLPNFVDPLGLDWVLSEQGQLHSVTVAKKSTVIEVTGPDPDSNVLSFGKLTSEINITRPMTVNDGQFDDGLKDTFSGGFEGDVSHSYRYRHTYMGDGQEPVPEQVPEVPYNDEKAYWLMGLICATPDVVADGAGYPSMPQVPALGSTYPAPSYPVQERPTTATYTATNADLVWFSTSDYTLQFNTQIQLTFSGNYESIYYDLSKMIVVPDHTKSSFQVTAVSTDSIVQTNEYNIVVGYGSQGVTLTMPVTAPSYSRELIAFRRDTFELPTTNIADRNTNNLQPRIVNGFDLNTLQFVRNQTVDYPTRFSGNIKLDGTIYKIKTEKGNNIDLFEMKPEAQQPLATRNAINAERNPPAGFAPLQIDISYNCHAYSFGLDKITDNQGNIHSFWVPSSSDVSRILTDLYQKIPSKDAATGNLAVFVDNSGGYAHSLKLANVVVETDTKTQGQYIGNGTTTVRDHTAKDRVLECCIPTR